MARDFEFEMDLSGFKEAIAELRKLPEKAERRIVLNASMSAMREARREIVKSAPKGDTPVPNGNMKYGTLRKNIRVRRFKLKGQRGQAGAKITTGNAFWGWILEKGSRNMVAQPWFDPAFERSKPRVLAKFREAVDKGLEKEWSKLK